MSKIKKYQLDFTGPNGIVNNDISTSASISTSKLEDGFDFINKYGNINFAADQSMGGFILTNLGNGQLPTDAVNLQQLNSLNYGLEQTIISNNNIADDRTIIVSPNKRLEIYTSGTYGATTQRIQSDAFVIIKQNGTVQNIFGVNNSGIYSQVTDTDINSVTSADINGASIMYSNTLLDINANITASSTGCNLYVDWENNIYYWNELKIQANVDYGMIFNSDLGGYTFPRTTPATGQTLIAGIGGALDWGNAGLTDGNGTTANGASVDLGGTQTANVNFIPDGYEFNIGSTSVAGFSSIPQNGIAKMGDIYGIGNGTYLSINDQTQIINIVSNSGAAKVHVSSTVFQHNGVNVLTANDNAASATLLETPRTISITGEATYTSTPFNGSANVTAAITLSNSAVIGKVLTGFTAGAGTVSSTDNILQAFQKNVGNLALKANLISPSFTTPNLGTPSSAVLTNATGLPIGGITGLGTGVATMLGTAVTGSGSIVGSVSPTFTSVPAAPTATAGTNTTQIATTAFVTGALGGTIQPFNVLATGIGRFTNQIDLGSANFRITASGTGAIFQSGVNAGVVSIGTTAAHASSILDLQTTTRGLLLPRLTKTQRDAIASPAAGLFIYQTDNTPGLRGYNGTNWMRYTETAD